jgi:S1-C subfamily serine protease
MNMSTAKQICFNKKWIAAILFFSLFRESASQDITRIESVQSLYVETFINSDQLGSGTGFIFKSRSRSYLITNWHVVTRKNPVTKEWLYKDSPIAPNRIKILHNSKKLGDYIVKEEILVDKSNKILFKEFRIGKEMVDVVAIPLQDTSGVSIYPVSYSDELDSLVLQPTDRLFVLGFPRGLRSTPSLPIWKSGLIASEPDIDQEGKPIVWLDIEGFPGMSGSPVYLITDKMIYKNGSSSQLVGGTKSFFVGVFSHDRGSNVGAVWKSKYLKELFSYLE